MGAMYIKRDLTGTNVSTFFEAVLIPEVGGAMLGGAAGMGIATQLDELTGGLLTPYLSMFAQAGADFGSFGLDVLSALVSGAYAKREFGFSSSAWSDVLIRGASTSEGTTAGGGLRVQGTFMGQLPMISTMN